MADLDLNSKTRNFSVELLHHALQDVKGDVMLSPYVIWSLLVSMAYESLGATREQVSKVFLLTENRSEFVEQFRNLQTAVLVNGGVNVTSQNFLFYDEDLHLYSYSIRRLERDFSFVTRSFNFKKPAEAAIQAFTTLEQCGMARWFLIKFTDFVDASMIMYNCLTFKAKWFKPFEKSEEKLYMKTRLRSSNFESLHASVTELPYDGGKHCMLLIRPHNRYGLKQVFRNLREESLKNIFSKLQSDADELGLKEVEEELPQGEINSHVILNKPLINMGLSDVFDQNSSNFDEFAEDKMYIHEIAQRVSVTFEQYQTIVQATTPSFEMKKRIPSKTIAVEDPFIFLIMETSTATVLFSGSYSTKDIYNSTG
ncbi:serine protease inhibitor 77Ba-like [Maniola hyperantus]|uniref:serine protease inhibitor 77Ba-like n=1 Tax=Aphantopus hyperantus TaxID=2795564 RepID=UPI0037482663